MGSDIRPSFDIVCTLIIYVVDGFRLLITCVRKLVCFRSAIVVPCIFHVTLYPAMEFFFFVFGRRHFNLISVGELSLIFRPLGEPTGIEDSKINQENRKRPYSKL